MTMPTPPADPQNTTPPAVQTPPAQTDPGKAPTFTGEFDQERAARLVENLRTELESAKAKLKTHEDAGKTELEKLAARAEAAEKLAAENAAALAAKTAADVHAEAVKTAAVAAKLPAEWHEFLTGKTPEELATQAAKLAAQLGIGTADPLMSRPKAVLVPGQGSGDTGGTFDAKAIAKNARRR